MWAILSGIEGNYKAYLAVLKDIKHQTPKVEALYILGDLIGPTPETEKLVQHLRNYSDAQICRGWWEEQCLIVHGVRATGEPTELLKTYGVDSVEKLWKFVFRETVEWLRTLDFGFVELDCLLIHGSSVNVSEKLTPHAPPWLLLDRLQRLGVNQLFCGRSGETFIYELEQASICSSVTTLEQECFSENLTITRKRIIGVGSVGKVPNLATYTIYNPLNNQIQFRQVCY